MASPGELPVAFVVPVGPVGVRGGEDVRRSGTIVCGQWLGITTFGQESDEDGSACG